jgi:putative restriction endonuclease
MPVSFRELVVRRGYDCEELARMWEYSGPQPLGKGFVTPSGTPFIIVFVTQEHNPFQPTEEDEGLFVRIEGRREDEIDGRILNAQVWGGEIHLFLRYRDHQKFSYKGIATVTMADIYVDRPNQFVLVHGPHSSHVPQRIRINAPENQFLRDYIRAITMRPKFNDGPPLQYPGNEPPAQEG